MLSMRLFCRHMRVQYCAARSSTPPTTAATDGVSDPGIGWLTSAPIRIVLVPVNPGSSSGGAGAVILDKYTLAPPSLLFTCAPQGGGGRQAAAASSEHRTRPRVRARARARALSAMLARYWSSGPVGPPGGPPRDLAKKCFSSMTCEAMPLSRSKKSLMVS